MFERRRALGSASLEAKLAQLQAEIAAFRGRPC